VIWCSGDGVGHVQQEQPEGQQRSHTWKIYKYRTWFHVLALHNQLLSALEIITIYFPEIVKLISYVHMICYIPVCWSNSCTPYHWLYCTEHMLQITVHVIMILSKVLCDKKHNSIAYQYELSETVYRRIYSVIQQMLVYLWNLRYAYFYFVVIFGNVRCVWQPYYKY
jgi:hypothetical protein